MYFIFIIADMYHERVHLIDIYKLFVPCFFPYMNSACSHSQPNLGLISLCPYFSSALGVENGGKAFKTMATGLMEKDDRTWFDIYGKYYSYSAE
jgi:hypothetical protein